MNNLPIKEGVYVVDEQIETEPVKVSVKRKEITQEAEAQVGNWSVVEEEEEEIEKEEKQEDEEEEEEEEEEKECIGEEEPSVKKPRYNPSVPVAPPSPPPPVQQDNEALSNLMMAWYYAGYYTGVYQVNIILYNSVLNIYLLYFRLITLNNTYKKGGILYYNIYTHAFYISAKKKKKKLK